MQYSTQARTYGTSQGTLITGSSIGNTGTANNGNKQIQSSSSYKLVEKKWAQAKRQSVLETQKNQEVFSSFPQLVISRVDSAEHRQKMKSNSSSNLTVGANYYNPLTTSLIAKTNRGDLKVTSTSMDKSANTYGARQYISSNQSDTNRPSYRPNYATYKRDTNMAPNYGTGSGNGEQDASDNQGNQGPSYKVSGKYTVEMMERDIAPHMVSSVYSREEKDSSSDKNQKIYLSTRLKDTENSAEEQAYDLYASRHPDQSIRRSTIEISKAISSNAITQLQRQNSSQGQIIKKLEKQLDQFKGSLKKWDQIKHRYAMDLQSKSRQIFDLQRANKRLTQQVQGIRTYRTMDTVQQVIIVRLKQQIMQLNKKIIEMQAEYYKNQKSLLEKTSKKQIKLQQQNDKQTIKKLQETTYMAKKQIQLLNVELQKQKEKSWKLEQQKQQYLAEKNYNKDNYEKEIGYLKKDINGLRQQVQKNCQMVRQREITIDQVKSANQAEIRKLTESLTRQLQQQKRLSQTQSNSRNLQIQKLNDQLTMKDRLMQQKISEQKNQFQLQLSQKLANKEQQSKNILNSEIRSLETQINNKTTLQIKKLSSQLNEKDRILQQKLAQQRVSFEREMSQRLNQKQQEFKNILSNNEKNMKSLEIQMNNQASSEIQKLSLQLNEKEQRLNEQKRLFQQELKDKLVQKQQQYKIALNNQMRLYESKIVEQGKTQKIKDSQNKQLIDRLKQEKQQSQALFKRKIAEAQQGLKAANLKLSQKDQQLRTVESKDKNSQQATNQYLAEIQNLKRALEESQNYIKDIQNQNENIKSGIRERDIQIEHLRVDNMRILKDMNNQINQKGKWKQEETFIIQNQLKLKIQEQFKQKQRQLQAKVASLSSQQQNIKQMRLKLQQDQQQQVLKVQNEIKQKQQKIQLQSIKQLQSTKTKLAEEVKKMQVNLSNINREVAGANSKKLQIQSEINLKQRQSKEIEVKIVQIKRDLQLKLNQVAQVESQKRNLTAETQKLKQAEQKQKVVNKQYQNKYNTTLTELNNFKVEFGKIQQKARQAQIQALRANQNINLWKMKSQNSESSFNKLKSDMANLEKQKQELKVKLRDAEENRAKGEIIKKYQQLLPEYDLLKQKLQFKQEEALSRQSAIVTLRKTSESGELKVSGLVKQVRNLTNKIDENEAKFKALLSKVQLDEYKYKQIYQKSVSDSEIYMTFIKKLQEDNELIAQKYWKVRKLVKKQKITDEHDLLEKKDDNKYKIFLEKQILNHFNKMIIPQFESKILQKLTACEAYITNKQKRLKRVRQMIDADKKRRQANRARSTN